MCRAEKAKLLAQAVCMVSGAQFAHKEKYEENERKREGKILRKLALRSSVVIELKGHINTIRQVTSCE